MIYLEKNGVKAMKINKYLNAFKGLVIYLTLSFLLEYIFASLFNTNNKLLENFVNLLTPTIIALVLITCFKDKFKNKFQDFKNNYATYLSLIMKYWLVGYMLMIITNAIISSITGNIAQNEENNRTLFNSLPLYSIIATIFLAPISEELTFRASFREISEKKNVFCLISGTLFGLLHVIFNGDYLFIIPYASFGYFLAKAYIETDNILVSILMHAWHNTFCIILLAIGGLI